MAYCVQCYCVPTGTLLRFKVKDKEVASILLDILHSPIIQDCLGNVLHILYHDVAENK